MSLIADFTDKHKERIVGLDILRSVAILIVVYNHGMNLLPTEFHPTYDAINLIRIDGVSIFFVLSGFLIGGILLKIISTTHFTTKDLINFWIRRWFRTIPNYMAVLLGILLLRFIFFEDVWSEFNYTYFLFLQNFWAPHPNFFPEAWSLTIEEWFYLLFPLTCFFFYKIFNSKTKSVLIAAMIFIVFPLVLRIMKFEYGIGIDEIDREFRKIVLLRLDSLMYGILGAYIVFKHPQFWEKFKYLFLAIGVTFLFCLYFRWIVFYLPITFNIESITAFCFLPYLSSLKTTRIKIIDSIFIFISIISYSMYLLNHTPIKGFVIPGFNLYTGRADLPIEETYLLNYTIYWVATLVGAYILYRFYENPMTKLRDRVKV